MSRSARDEALWNVAWDWVIREHEQALDDAAKAELAAWLKADPTHLKNYEEAHRIWLGAAMLPPDDEPESPPRT